MCVGCFCSGLPNVLKYSFLPILSLKMTLSFFLLLFFFYPQQMARFTYFYSQLPSQVTQNVAIRPIHVDYKIDIITIDDELLCKILHQLINNAIKFTSHGQITIGFEKKEDECHFFVKDSGKGISEEYKNKIFGDFDQGDNTNTRKYQGTGLGLSIAKGLTELLGGHLWLKSEKGKGSTFQLSIPLIHNTMS